MSIHKHMHSDFLSTFAIFRFHYWMLKGKIVHAVHLGIKPYNSGWLTESVYAYRWNQNAEDVICDVLRPFVYLCLSFFYFFIKFTEYRPSSHHDDGTLDIRHIYNRIACKMKLFNAHWHHSVMLRYSQLIVKFAAERIFCVAPLFNGGDAKAVCCKRSKKTVIWKWHQL